MTITRLVTAMDKRLSEKARLLEQPWTRDVVINTRLLGQQWTRDEETNTRLL